MTGNFRRTVRGLAKSRGFTAIAVLTLGLGIGASTAIFTVVNTVLLRPLRYADPDRLVSISAPASNEPGAPGWLSLPHFRLQRDRNRSFSAIAASTFEVFNLTGHGEPEQIASARVSWNFFQLLGVQPRIGRGFLPEEDQPGANRVVLISHELSQRLFGDGTAPGQSLSLNSQSYTIIGVLPPGFTFPLVGGKVDIWAPRVFDLSLVTPARVEAGGPYFHIVGRLRPGVTREQARAEAQGIYEQYRHDNPGKYDATIDAAMAVRDLHERFAADLRPTLLILSAAVGLLLLIACSNVASLQFARVLRRRKEIGVRAALGARRRSIIFQLLTENLALSALSAIFGVIIGLAGASYLASAAAEQIQIAPGTELDIRFFAFALATALLSGILIGLVPSLELSKPDLNSVLRDEGRGTSGSRKRSRTRSVLVVAQVALSTMLLIASGLLIRSFVRLSSVSPGFQPDHLLTLEMTLPQSKYSTRSRLIGFYDGVLREVRALPGVQSAALSTALPAVPTHRTPALFEGEPLVPLGKRPIVNIQQLTPDYAQTLRIPLLAGRVFTEHDDANAPPAAVLNQTAAQRFWPKESAVGKRVWIGNLPTPYQVVGVLADVKNGSLAAPPDAEVFLPLPQLPWTLLYLSVRTAGDPHAMISAVRRGIAAADREQPLTKVQTGEELLESANAQVRFTALLVGVFSITAFLISAVGIYGVIAYSVAQRRQELGIRIAVGATRADVFRLVVGGGLRLTAIGILLGLAGSLAATRLMSALLFETSATDAWTFGTIAALFTAVGALAAYLPARRAAGIDPTDALRAE